MKKPAVNATKRRQAPSSSSSSSSSHEEESRGTISLRPVDFNALNLTDPDNCNCDFADRIGNFKSWFIVLVVLGVISFLGAIVTIIVLLVKCAKSRSAEKKLLQTPQRVGSSLYYKTSVIVDWEEETRHRWHLLFILLFLLVFSSVVCLLVLRYCEILVNLNAWMMEVRAFIESKMR